jgi:hypothetical protein
MPGEDTASGDEAGTGDDVRCEADGAADLGGDSVAGTDPIDPPTARGDGLGPAIGLVPERNMKAITSTAAPTSAAIGAESRIMGDPRLST